MSEIERLSYPELLMTHFQFIDWSQEYPGDIQRNVSMSYDCTMLRIEVDVL